MPISVSPNQRTNLGSYTERCKRKIARVPIKVLDAPTLQDDFYLNLVDWFSQNVFAVGLGSCVYLWNAATSRVTQLCNLSSTEDAVTSVAWSEGENTWSSAAPAVTPNHGTPLLKNWYKQ